MYQLKRTLIESLEKNLLSSYDVKDLSQLYFDVVNTLLPLGDEPYIKFYNIDGRVDKYEIVCGVKYETTHFHTMCLVKVNLLYTCGNFVITQFCI